MATEEKELIHPPVIQEHSVKNYAPLEPLLAIARGNTKVESSLGKALRERFNHHYACEKKIRESMIEAGYRNAMLMEGKQFLTPNPFRPGTFLPYTPAQPSDREKRAMNLMRFYTTNNLWKWQLSNPDIVAVAGIDTEQARESAQAADIIIENHERRFFPPTLTIQEGLQGLAFGSYVWGVRYDASQHSITVLQPIMGISPVTLGEGFGTCENGHQGTAANFSQVQPDPLGPVIWICNQCGGEADVEPPANELMPAVVGQQEVKLGQLTADLKAFPECAWDYRFPVEDSSWFIHMRETSATAVRRLLGDIRLPQSGEGMNDFGLQVMRKLGWASGGGSGTATQDERKREIFKDPAVIIEYSISPDDYADIVIGKATETVCGESIPAGPLVDTYPAGMTIQGINGLAVITGIFAEHHKSNHKSGIWFPRVSSGAGQGLDDLAEVQKRFTADDSQIRTYLKANSTPGLRVLKEAIAEESRGQYLGDPLTNIFYNAANIPEGYKPEDIIGPVFQPGSIPAQFFGYTYQHLNNFAQITSHITDFSGGLPGVKNSTATGAQITQSNSNALFTPPLQVKGEVRLRIAQIVVELYRIHFPVERYFPLKGKNGRQMGKYLSGADLSTDIQFEVVRDSELPRNMFTKREDYFAFFSMLGNAQGYEQLQQTNPELLVEIERVFNVTLNSEALNQMASLCQQRLDQLKQFVELVPDPTLLTGLAKDPTTGMVIPIAEGIINPPIAEEEPDHDIAAKWLSEWLAEDEGQKAGPVMRGCVQLLIRYHFQIFGMQQAEIAFQMGSAQAAGAAPGAIGAAMGGAINNEINPVPDVNNDVPKVGGTPPGPTGRPKPKGK